MLMPSFRFRDRFSFRFLGVRHAPQPERFTYSVPYVGNDSEVSATEYGSQCVQAGNVGSEDCLFLNIWTTYLPGPNSTKENLKPVMVSVDGCSDINLQNVLINGWKAVDTRRRFYRWDRE